MQHGLYQEAFDCETIVHVQRRLDGCHVNALCQRRELEQECGMIPTISEVHFESDDWRLKMFKIRYRLRQWQRI
jgi:hypothetical protein